MAFILKVTGTKSCEGGVELKLSFNGGAYSEGRVYPSLSAALQQVADNPMTVDDLLYLILRVAQAQGLTAAQVASKTLTVNFNDPNGNIVTFA